MLQRLNTKWAWLRKTTNHGGEGTERRWQGSGPKARAATAEEGEARRVCHRMSAIFDGYEREYCDLSTQLGRKINQLGALAGDSRNQKARDITNDLSEADALIRRMDLEARSLPPGKKNPLLSKLREYKAAKNVHGVRAGSHLRELRPHREDA